MNTFNPRKINQLARCLYLASSLLLSACAAQGPLSGQTPATPQLLTIDADTAAAMVDQAPLELLTDYASPDQCLLSYDTPVQPEAPWVAPQTVWQRIRLGYRLDASIRNPRIDAEFNWYQRNPAYMARVSRRAERYLFYVTDQLEQRGLPLELALLPIVESAFDPFAYSHGRAAGMWQFIPGTARIYDMDINWWYDGRRDIVASTEGAIRYLTKLNNYYDGDWMLALAAYNSGRGNVNKAIRRNKKLGKPTDFWSLDLPRETRSYVPKLLALARLIDNPRLHGIELYDIANTPYFAIVDTGSQIDLAEAAKLADLDIEELYRLNPGFNKWATAPDGPHRLLVPVDNADLFKQQLAGLPAGQRLHWNRYTIRNGDSLLLLAKKFNTDVATIKSVNNIRGNTIVAGKSLLIPIPSQQGKHYSLSAEQRLASIQNHPRGSNRKQVFHTVRAGDSLWTISRQYGVKVSQLAKWNGMAPRDVLKPGKKLSVWTRKPLQVASAGQRESVVRKVGYRVRSGDSLARIAGKFNVRVSDIIKWNAVNPDKYLQPGQHLTLYIDIMNAVN